MWLKAQTQKVILRTQETLWEEQRVWAVGRVLRAFRPRQASPHKEQLPRQALVSEKPGEGRIWQPSSLGVRGEMKRMRKFTLGTSGTRAVRGLSEPELYSLGGCVVAVVVGARSGGRRIQ